MKSRSFYHKTIVVPKKKLVFSGCFLLLAAVLLGGTKFPAVRATCMRAAVTKAVQAVFPQKTEPLEKQTVLWHIKELFPIAKAEAAAQKWELARKSGVKKEEQKEQKKEEIALPYKIKETDMSEEGITYRNETAYIPETEALLNQTLSFENPRVLIVHTHTSEAYIESEGARSKDSTKNVVRIGEVLKQELERLGVLVLHDTTQNDSPSYNGSYNKAMKTIQKQIEQHPDIQVVIDLHRDYAEQTKNNETLQLKPVTKQNGAAVAQMMLVVGTDGRGLTHPEWKENLAFAVQLQRKMQSLCPKVCRPINLRRERFNQHLTRGSLILEVGTAGNTLKECERAAVIFANALAAVL